MRIREICGPALATSLASGLLAASCGGGDDAPTKAEFIEQADAICKKAHRNFEKEFQQAFGGERPSNADLKNFAKSDLVPGTEGQIAEISALEPPSGDQAQVDAIIEAVQAGVDKIKADPGILLPSVPEDPLAEGHRLAKEYGMKECAT
jgi:hypothetical protein